MDYSNKLGFGMMRLPRKGPMIDIGRTSEMVDMFLDAGFNYFDTAYVYPGSEKAVKKALVDRYPRDQYELATKLNVMGVVSEAAAKSEFEKSLKKTGAGYFDNYLLHAIMDGNYAKYEKLHLWDFVAKKKQEGLIRRIGFSFHGSPALLRKVFEEHPEAEFVLLQINYADWNDKRVASHKNYEIAREFGKPVYVMEPVKGGRLANPPAAVRKIFEDADPDASYAEWALRFAGSLDGVRTVLSGMSTEDQMRENIAFMKNFRPLSSDEIKVIERAREELGKSAAIPCTGCGYCLPQCPQQIQIPDILAAMNKWQGGGQLSAAKLDYEQAITGNNPASVCLACGRCEKTCPQQIEIVQDLKEAAARFEGE